MRLMYVILSILLAFSSNLVAQNNNSHDEKSSKFNKYKKELDYSKTKKIWVPKENEKSKERNKTDKIYTNWGEGISGIFAVLGYLLLILIVISVLYFVFKDVNTNPKVSIEDIDLDNIQDIEAIDFDKLLNQALEKQDYRLALRTKFLKILKQLAQNDKIQWKPYKTNRDYVRELKDMEYKDQFRFVADAFEHIWYGVSTVNISDYSGFSKYFDDFLKQIV